MSDTVILDGELSLTSMLDGEAGTVVKVAEYDLPMYTGATTVEPDFVGVVLMTAYCLIVFAGMVIVGAVLGGCEVD